MFRILPVLALLLATPALARGWPAEKCHRSSDARLAAAQRLGTEGLCARLPGRPCGLHRGRLS